MRKLTTTETNFLESFSNSNEWSTLRDLFIRPLINDVERVNGDLQFIGDFTAGEKYAGRQIASDTLHEIINLVNHYNKVKKTEKKPEDNFN